MNDKTFRVGIIGADTAASWAGASHIPALATQPHLKLAAVATRREESAKAAAEAFGAERWYADPYAMIDDPSIDVVTVAVKVPAHRDLVLGRSRLERPSIPNPHLARRSPRPKRWPQPKGRCIRPSDFRGAITRPFDERPKSLRPAGSDA